MPVEIWVPHYLIMYELPSWLVLLALIPNVPGLQYVSPTYNPTNLGTQGRHRVFLYVAILKF